MTLVTVRDVLTLPVLSSATVIAGRGGLERTVTGVNVMEVPDIEDYVAAGELLLTTAYPVRERPERLVELIPALADRGLAALAIKPLRYLEQLPEGLTEVADRLDFPVIVVSDDTSFNEVIGAVLAVAIAEYGPEPAKAEAIRERLTGVALAGGGLDEIARALSGALSRDVLILDTAGTTLGQASGGTSPVDASAHWEFAVTVAGHQRGSIVVGGEDEPTLGQRRLIRQACFAAGMHVAQEMAAAELDRRMRLLFLEEIVTGQTTDLPTIRQRARLFGWELDGTRMVIVTATSSELADSLVAAAAAEVFGRQAIAWARGQEVIAIVPEGPLGADSQLRAESWHQRLHAMSGGPVTVAIGSAATDPRELAASHASARAALRIAEASGMTVVQQSTVAVERLLMTMPDHDLSVFVRDTIGPLIEHDRQSGSQLCDTLEAYVTLPNGADAARELFVHYNTLKHRLARIVDILGCDLHDPRQRLALALALTGRRVLPHGAEG